MVVFGLTSVSPLQIRLASHSFMHMPLKISKTIEFNFHSSYYSSLFQLFTKQKNAKINCSIKVTDKAQNLKSPLTHLQHSYMHRLCTFFNYTMLQKVWYDYHKILDIFVTFNKNALKILIFTQNAGIPIICFSVRTSIIAGVDFIATANPYLINIHRLN